MKQKNKSGQGDNEQTMQENGSVDHQPSSDEPSLSPFSSDRSQSLNRPAMPVSGSGDGDGVGTGVAVDSRVGVGSCDAVRGRGDGEGGEDAARSGEAVDARGVVGASDGAASTTSSKQLGQWAMTLREGS